MARIIDAGLKVSGQERVPPLVLQIADRLEREIIAGRYVSGEWIREQDIADRLGTSRGPVREAFRLVAIDGLIEIVPWRGARVVDMSLSEIDDLLEVVAALQGLVSRLAAAHASPADIDRVERLIEEMETTVEASDAMAHQLHLAFEAGSVLRETCGSERAGSMLMKVGRVAYWQHRHLLAADRRWRRSAVRKWRDLLAALRNRDGERSDRAARAMVHHSKSLILDVLRDGRSVESGTQEELPAAMRSVGLP